MKTRPHRTPPARHLILALLVAAAACEAPEEEESNETDPGDTIPEEDTPERTPGLDGVGHRAAPGTTAAPITTVILIPGTTIPGSYFDDMAARLEADGFDPVVFEPPDLFTESLAVGAQRIDAFVEEWLASTGQERVHVVAECNGGVATRYWLQVLGGHERVGQVVSFVSAHHGTVTSPLGEWVTGYQSLADITPGSPFLAELDAAPFPRGLSFTSIYTCSDEFIYPYDTSVIAGATNVLFCDYYLGHFDGFWDLTVYERILASLEGRGAEAPTYY